MRLVTVRTEGGTAAGRIDGGEIVLLRAPDVGALLREGPGAVRSAAEAGRIDAGEASLAPVVPRPDKIICVGKNYVAHSAEMGGAQPQHPTYFAKFARALIGPRDDIEIPPPEVSTRVDWEGELAVVIGRPVRRASRDEALHAVAGYTVLNDVSVRDFQRRTSQFLAGKTWERSTPIGPALVTPDEVPPGAAGLRLTTHVEDVLKQDARTSEMVFSVADVIADLSRIVTLDPGDVIAMGTPNGVGDAREPRERLAAGSVVRVTIEGIGTLANRCVTAPA